MIRRTPAISLAQSSTEALDQKDSSLLCLSLTEKWLNYSFVEEFVGALCTVVIVKQNNNKVRQKGQFALIYTCSLVTTKFSPYKQSYLLFALFHNHNGPILY